MEADVYFVNALSAARLMDDLRSEELAGISTSLGEQRGSARYISFLVAYYEAAGDEHTARRRNLTDRFFLHRAEDRASARDLVSRLTGLCPELERVELERIGDTKNGALLLRCGEHLAGIIDDYEIDMDTDEIDLRDLEEERPTITVRGLVRAMNILLDRHGVARRFVQLRSDVYREAYISMFKEDALALCDANLLEHDGEELAEHAAW